MNMKKYILTKNKKVIGSRTLFQIKAVASFGLIVKGDLGGWIEEEKNLHQSGNAWVFGDAWVSDNAQVSGDARVSGDAWVCDNAQVSGDARVFGDARVSGNAWVSGNAQVFGKLKISSKYFFGYLCGGEKIKKIKNEDGSYLIGKE